MYETYIGKTIDDHIHGFKTMIISAKAEVKYQRANSPFIFLIVLKEITIRGTILLYVRHALLKK